MANNGKFGGLSCQKCRTRIDIDASIDQLNPVAFKLLTDSTVPDQQQASRPFPNRQSRPTYPSARHDTYKAAAKTATAPTFKRNVPSSRFQHGSQNPAMSFISVHMSESMLESPSPTLDVSCTSERQVQGDDGQPNSSITMRRINHSGAPGTVGGANMAEGLETTDRMFEILSARSDIDHPICVECTELLVEGLQKRLSVATRERDAYIDYLRRANTDVPSAEEVEAAEAALKAAKSAEAAAIADLEKLEAEKAGLDAELASLDLEARRLDQEENEFWRNRNKFNSKLMEFQNERDALTTRYAHDVQVLNQLQRRSVYNDTFNITHDNHYATINGLRLGRLPNPYVDWPEINAAWGQTCLLLASLAERLEYTFQGYELCPMGSTSTINQLEGKDGRSVGDRGQKLELFSSGDFPINFAFLHRKFDSAMVGFLECLRQLGNFVENQGVQGVAPGIMGAAGGPGIKMPYEIRKDKINDVSIKLASNKEESWTKACKYTLTCCKYLLAHANNIESRSAKRAR